MTNEKRYTCPVCGYAELDGNPYLNMPPVTELDYSLQPPYTDHFGRASYDVCPCCGFEYGLEDDPPNRSLKRSFQEYLKAWVEEDKMQWMEKELMPPNWSLAQQLAAAGLPVPDFAK